MELIQCEKSRRLRLKKRALGLKKKLHELTTLCDIDGFMICYPKPQEEDEKNHPIDPITWPESRNELLHLITEYNNLKSKGNRLLKRRKIETSSTDQGIDGFSLEQLRELQNLLDSKLELVNLRIQLLENTKQGTSETGYTGCSISDLDMGYFGCQGCQQNVDFEYSYRSLQPEIFSDAIAMKNASNASCDFNFGWTYQAGEMGFSASPSDMLYDEGQFHDHIFDFMYDYGSSQRDLLVNGDDAGHSLGFPSMYQVIPDDAC